MSSKIGFCVFYHPYEEGASHAREIQEKGREFLASHQLDIVEAPVLVHDLESARKAGDYFSQARVDVIVLHLATWSDDNLLIEMIACHDVPVVTWALRDMNTGSLCGCQQFGMVLHELGKRTCFVLDHSGETVSKIVAFATGVTGETHPATIHRASVETEYLLLKRIKHLRIGIIGARTQGMMEVAFDEFGLKEVLGFSVISISLDEVKEKATSVSIVDATRAIDLFLECNGRVQQQISRDEMIQAGRMYIGLKGICHDLALESLAVECYPRFMGSACIPFSMLSDDGISCACEGDVHAAFLMWLVRAISSEPSNHIDLLDVDVDANTIVGSHCGSCSIKIADTSEPATVSHVRLAHSGGCIIFPSKPGEVTLASLVGRSGTYRACILHGEAIRAGLIFPGNPVSIRLDKPVHEFLNIVEANGLGHHWVVAYGRDVGNVIAVLFRRLGVRVIQ